MKPFLFMAMENWKVIPGFEGRYEVSDHGTVKSFLKGGRVLKTSKNFYGYKTVSLTYPCGRVLSIGVHRLVLITFSGKEEGKMALHNDGNKENNKLSNLRWGDHKDNYADTVLHGTAIIGEAHPWTRLSKEAVFEIRSDSGTAHKKRMMGKYGICEQHAALIMKRKIWKHI